MHRNQLVRTFALASLILSLLIGWQQESAIAQSAKNTAESPIKEIQAPELPKVSPKTSPDAKNLSPRISFEKTVCDLGDVGQGTKNTCEFKFTNIGQALLKIGKIKRTCGCTVFELDRKEYAPGRTGTIRVSYIAGKATALRQKHIYVPSNDKVNPKVKLTIKARVVQMVEAAPQKLGLSLRKGSGGAIAKIRFCCVHKALCLAAVFYPERSKISPLKFFSARRQPYSRNSE